MVTKRTDYTAEAVAAARSVMLELTRLLGEYQEGIVLIGGWVPELLLSGGWSPAYQQPGCEPSLDPHALGEAEYKTILQLLLARGYFQGVQPFIFFRKVQMGNAAIEVEVDFLAGEYAGTGRSHRTQNIQDMQLHKARGCDLAFSEPNEITLNGTLPEGGKDSVRFRVASIAPFLVIKAMAMASRLKEKYARDKYYCIHNFPGGIGRLAEEFRPLLESKLAQEALANIVEKFASLKHVGPKHVADFEEVTDAEERARLQTKPAFSCRCG